MRRPLVVGNWKMNGSKKSVAALVDQFLQLWQGVHKAEVAMCPPYVHLYQVSRQLAESNVVLGAQDVSVYADGAYTGDVSATMLSDMFCHFVIIGHSERRQYYKESNELIAQKCRAVLAAQMVPIVCVGELLEQREAEQTLAVIEAQLQAVIDVVGVQGLNQSVVAYEPVWAIGTGLTASPQQAEEVHAFIRAQLGPEAKNTRILYGGSVKGANAQELFTQPNIDGGLIGGASLKADEFYQICQAAELE